MDVPNWTQVTLSLAAVVGVYALITGLKDQSKDPLIKRFIFALWVTIALFAGRALFEIFGGYGSRALIVASASLVPLAVLILTEALLRRHAPAMVKVWASAGAVVFFLSAFVPSQWIDPARVTLLLIYQLGVFLSCAWLTFFRDRTDLSPSEDQVVSKLSLTLLFLIPLIFADYLLAYLGLPYQVSALGVLCLCWLSLGLGNSSGTRRTVLFGLAAMAAIALLAALSISMIRQDEWRTTLEVFAVVLAAILVSKILFDARDQRGQMRSLGLLKQLAYGPIESSGAFLDGFRGHPALESAVVIQGDDLADFDPDVLARLFHDHPVLRKMDKVGNDTACQDHADHLFSRYQASHIMKVSEDPLVLIAMSLPGLGISSKSDLELAAIQRMAILAGR